MSLKRAFSEPWTSTSAIAWPFFAHFVQSYPKIEKAEKKEVLPWVTSKCLLMFVVYH